MVSRNAARPARRSARMPLSSGTFPERDFRYVVDARRCAIVALSVAAAMCDWRMPLADLLADLGQEGRSADLALAHQAQPVGGHLLENLAVVGIGGVRRQLLAFARATAIVVGALHESASARDRLDRGIAWELAGHFSSCAGMWQHRAGNESI